MRFENFNQKIFIHHLPQQLRSRESSHTKHIYILGSWGTDLELLAAATYFQIALYYCCIDNKTNQWCIQPIASPVVYPIVNSYPERDMATIVYWSDTHYDSVVSKTGSAITDLPAIPDDVL
jgi:hypothetical protein